MGAGAASVGAGFLGRIESMFKKRFGERSTKESLAVTGGLLETTDAGVGVDKPLEEGDVEGMKKGKRRKMRSSARALSLEEVDHHELTLARKVSGISGEGGMKWDEAEIDSAAIAAARVKRRTDCRVKGGGGGDGGGGLKAARG